MTKNKVIKLLDADKKLISLDRLVGDEDDSSVLDLIENTKVTPPEADIEQELLANQLRAMLACLSPWENNVIKLRYGLQNSPALSFDESAKVLGISPERARQLEHRALRKLRMNDQARQFRAYLNN
jgi:RNA polymerase sigma factor (sigma-70 family)